MKRTTTPLATIALLSAVCLPVPAWAQFGAMELAGMRMAGGQTVRGTGTVVLSRRPTLLRMHVELLAKGKTPEEALEKLKDRREAAVAQVEMLEAVKESVSCGDPSFSNLQAAQKKQFEQMIRQRMSSRGRKVPKGLQTAKTFSASAVLMAEWPIQGDSPEERLLAVRAMEEKLKAADLGGAKEAEKMSAEEEEMAEEMANMMGSGEEKVAFGQPVFTYVAEVSDADRKAAMAKAFGKAKKQASELAQAAGVKLGPLAGLGGYTRGTGMENMMTHYGGYSPQQYQQSLAQRQAGGEKDDEQTQATASTLGPVRFNIAVVAVYKLEE